MPETRNKIALLVTLMWVAGCRHDASEFHVTKVEFKNASEVVGDTTIVEGYTSVANYRLTCTADYKLRPIVFCFNASAGHTYHISSDDNLGAVSVISFKEQAADTQVFTVELETAR